MSEELQWLIALAIIFGVPWSRVWDKLFGNPADEQEEEVTHAIDPSSCDEGDLVIAKTECLKLAHTITTDEGKFRSADAIVADAQKFWDFLLKTEDGE